MENANDRIRAHTPQQVNERIDVVTEATYARAAAGGRDAVVRRIDELDREWDVDRTVLASFAILGGLSSVLGERSRPWKYFFRVQQTFLLWHAFVGWCPPAAVARRMGVRTWQEIGRERAALAKLLPDSANQPSNRPLAVAARTS